MPVIIQIQEHSIGTGVGTIVLTSALHPTSFPGRLRGLGMRLCLFPAECVSNSSATQLLVNLTMEGKRGKRFLYCSHTQPHTQK